MDKKIPGLCIRGFFIYVSAGLFNLLFLSY